MARRFTPPRRPRKWLNHGHQAPGARQLPKPGNHREVAQLPVTQTGRVDVDKRGGTNAAYPPGCRAFVSGAAQESNLPTVGLPRPAGFEGRLGSALRTGLSAVCAPDGALPGALRTRPARPESARPTAAPRPGTDVRPEGIARPLPGRRVICPATGRSTAAHCSHSSDATGH
jgi:hypothetical protein